jgi:hypothetical protein
MQRESSVVGLTHNDKRDDQLAEAVVVVAVRVCQRTAAGTCVIELSAIDRTRVGSPVAWRSGIRRRISSNMTVISARARLAPRQKWGPRATRCGAVVSAADSAALEDTLELLSDPDAMANIARARQEVADGNTVSAEQLRAKFLR